MSQIFMIAATGTGVGKTFITTVLAYQYTQGGYIVQAIKPVISGFSYDDVSNDSALILQSLGKQPTADAIAAISPWRFKAALSPHLAARAEAQAPRLEEVVKFCNDEAQKHKTLFVETAGGVMSPLNECATMMDWMCALDARIILIAGSYLGSISHTLTALKVLPAEKLHAVIISASDVNCAGLPETADAIRQFAQCAVPVYTVARAEKSSAPWKLAPNLSEICLNTQKI